MGLKSTSKGRRGEQEVVQLARAAGLHAERTWHLAQSVDAQRRCCDVLIAGQPYQVKRRRDGFGELYDGLVNVAVLFVRGDGSEWLAVLPAAQLLRLLAASRI